MAEAMTLLREYLSQRGRGTPAAHILEMLRPRLEQLPFAERASLIHQIRQFEKQRIDQAADSPSSDHAATPAVRSIKSLSPARKKHTGTIRTPLATLSTMRLMDTSIPAGDYFPPHGSVLLIQREGGRQYRAHPASTPHDVVIGRADHTLTPDIDLSAAEGNQRSISRVHLMLRHNRENNTVSAIDMGSANGTYLNGQRLYPHEIRILRHGDELRLGNLVFNLYFAP